MRTLTALLVLIGPAAHADPPSPQTQDEIVARVTALLDRLAPTTCPTGMAMGGKPGTYTAFCIEKVQRPSTFYQNAQTTCALVGRYVCTYDQWYIGSQTPGVTQMCNDDWEWTGDRDFAHPNSGYLQIVAGAAECTRQSWDWTDQHDNGSTERTYRCCTGALSARLE